MRLIMLLFWWKLVNDKSGDCRCILMQNELSIRDIVKNADYSGEIENTHKANWHWEEGMQVLK